MKKVSNSKIHFCPNILQKWALFSVPKKLCYREVYWNSANHQSWESQKFVTNSKRALAVFRYISILVEAKKNLFRILKTFLTKVAFSSVSAKLIYFQLVSSTFLKKCFVKHCIYFYFKKLKDVFSWKHCCIFGYTVGGVY